MFNDEFNGQGGSFQIRDGKRVRIDEEQQRHPGGDRPRDADGNALDRPAEVAPALVPPPADPAPAEAGPARRRGRGGE